MKQYKKFDDETQIFFSELPLMKPLEASASGGSSVWVFGESMTVHWFDSTRKKYTLRIPTDFHTDFASTPRWIWWWLPPFDIRYTPACLPHDLGYEKTGYLTLWVEDARTGLRTPMETRWTRLALDQLMLAGMRSRDVSELKCQAIYRAVRVGGGSAWDEAQTKRSQNVDKRRESLGYSNGVRG